MTKVENKEEINKILSSLEIDYQKPNLIKLGEISSYIVSFASISVTVTVPPN